MFWVELAFRLASKCFIFDSESALADGTARVERLHYEAPFKSVVDPDERAPACARSNGFSVAGAETFERISAALALGGKGQQPEGRCIRRRMLCLK